MYAPFTTNHYPLNTPHYISFTVHEIIRQSDKIAIFGNTVTLILMLIWDPGSFTLCPLRSYTDQSNTTYRQNISISKKVTKQYHDWIKGLTIKQSQLSSGVSIIVMHLYPCESCCLEINSQACCEHFGTSYFYCEMEVFLFGINCMDR